MSDSISFVTGASGFIASHVVQQLLDMGHKVHATVRRPPQKKEENTASSGHARAMAQQIDIIQGQLPCTWLIWSSNERLFVQLSIMLHCPSSSKTPSVMAKRRWLDQLWKGPIMCWMQSRNAKLSKLSCWHHPWQLFLATMPMWWKQSKRHCLLSISTQHAQWNTMLTLCKNCCWKGGLEAVWSAITAPTLEAGDHQPWAHPGSVFVSNLQI